jgi:hypothetical protein
MPDDTWPIAVAPRVRFRWRIRHPPAARFNVSSRRQLTFSTQTKAAAASHGAVVRHDQPTGGSWPVAGIPGGSFGAARINRVSQVV